LAGELTIGTHRVRLEGDTVFTRWIGPPELADVIKLDELFQLVVSKHERVFLVHDMSRSGLPSRETRRWIANWLLEQPLAGVVSFGASLPVRVLQSLLTRGASLLGRKPAVLSVQVGSEAEAFAWVEARRRQLTQQPDAPV